MPPLQAPAPEGKTIQGGVGLERGGGGEGGGGGEIPVDPRRDISLLPATTLVALSLIFS